MGEGGLKEEWVERTWEEGEGGGHGQEVWIEGERKVEEKRRREERRGEGCVSVANSVIRGGEDVDGEELTGEVDCGGRRTAGRKRR